MDSRKYYGTLTLRKPPKWVITAIKRSIFFLAWGYILYRFLFDEALSISQFPIFDAHWGFYVQLTTLFALTFLNWGIESYKWKLSIAGFCPLSFSKSFVGILFGLSVAIFTPNRSGEYVGRIWVIPEAARVKSIFATVFSNFMQLSVTLIFGVIALYFWQQKFLIPFDLSRQNVFVWTVALGGFIAVLIAVSYYYIRRTGKTKTEVIEHIKAYLRTWSFSLILKLWMLSLLRYLVFIVQFWILLKMFQTPISFFDVYCGIGIMYLVMAIIPILTFAEPAVRSTLSVLFLTVYNTNEMGIISASLALWVVNLAIPALIGSVLLNSIKTKDYD
jgi:uncharacterized membrane protein YbhN (UPF0104 family)